MENTLSEGDGKGYQLRVRITADERDALERIRSTRGQGETISDVVREALALLIKQNEGSAHHTALQKKVQTLATLLKREPRQVEQACIEGVFDLIENKARVPLIVMESQLHLSYGNPEGIRQYPWEV
jgi:Arc/MetJ-type ribon-helix-helix transcriptional regulator